MKRSLRRVVLYTALTCLAVSASAQAVPDTLTVPQALEKALAGYRQQDDLEGWIYQRLQFADEEPARRIGFLMRTQKEAWRGYRTYGERLAWFDLLALQGYYQLQAGNILASITAYETALQFYEAYPLPDADIIEYVLKPLGNNYTRLADYPTALYIHEKTLALALKRGNHSAVASVYSNMAVCARWKGDLSAATGYCRKGIALADRTKALYGLLLGVYADVLAEQERYDSAALLCRQSLQHLRGDEASVRYWRAATLQTAARIALGQKQYAAAAGLAQKAVVLLDRHFPAARWREKAKVQVLLGDIHLKKGNSRQALPYYHQALELLLPSWKGGGLYSLPPEEILYSENTISDALAGKAAALQRQHKEADALQHYLAVFMAERKLRRAFYSTESKLKQLQLARTRADAAMQVAYSLWITTGHPGYREKLLLIAELSKAQVLADERQWRLNIPAAASPADSLYRKSRQLQEAITYYQHEGVHAGDKKRIAALLQAAEYELSLVNKQLMRHAPEMAGEGRLLTVEGLYRLLNGLPRGVSVLEFFEGADSSYLLELDRQGIQSVRLIRGGRQLQRTIPQFMQQWFARGPSAMIQAPDSFYHANHQLYAAVFGNFTWKKNQRYLLVPDGHFNYLPFDALLTEPGYRPDPARWPFLLQKAALSRAYSLQVWDQQQTASYPAGLFAAFFVARGKDRAQPVLAVRQEYDLLKGRISGSYHLDSSATWPVFLKEAARASVLHVGTHAVSSSHDSLPYLQLYDRPFYLFDLRYLRLTPSLIVLGACQTADGRLMEGEGINSISRSFVAAGAGGVVSGLWNVNDQAAIGLTQLFYRQLEQGKDPAQSLHSAKQQWLHAHRENPVLQLPYYWSGMIYSGHLQKVPLPQRPRYWPYSLGGLLLAGVLSFYWIKRRKSGPYLQGLRKRPTNRGSYSR